MERHAGRARKDKRGCSVKWIMDVFPFSWFEVVGQKSLMLCSKSRVAIVCVCVCAVSGIADRQFLCVCYLCFPLGEVPTVRILTVCNVG